MMPTIMRIGPYRFFFYSNEGNEAPHVHVAAGDAVAKFWLQPVALAANHGFAGKALSDIERHAVAHSDKLDEAWHG